MDGWAALCMLAWICRAVMSRVLSSWGLWAAGALCSHHSFALVSKAAVFEARGTVRAAVIWPLMAPAHPCCLGLPESTGMFAGPAAWGALSCAAYLSVQICCGRQATRVGWGAEAGPFRSFEACRVVGRCRRAPHFPCWVFDWFLAAWFGRMQAPSAALERHLGVSKWPGAEGGAKAPGAGQRGRSVLEQYGHGDKHLDSGPSCIAGAPLERARWCRAQ